MMLAVKNSGTEDIVLRPVEGVLVDAESGESIRRFTLMMDYQDVNTAEARLAPDSNIELRLRTPMGVPPIDTQRHTRVVFIAELRSDSGSPLRIESRPLDVLLTQ